MGTQDGAKGKDSGAPEVTRMPVDEFIDPPEEFIGLCKRVASILNKHDASTAFNIGFYLAITAADQMEIGREEFMARSQLIWLANSKQAAGSKQ